MVAGNGAATWNALPGSTLSATPIVTKEEWKMLDGRDAGAIEAMAVIKAWRDLAIRWELSWHERVALLPRGGEDTASPPEDTEKRMRILVEIGYRLRFEDDEVMCEWLRAPAEMWNWHSPLEVMSASLPDLRRFRAFIEMGLGS